MSGVRDTLQRFRARLGPGPHSFLAWWGQALTTWLPVRWRVLLGLTGDRLLFQRQDDEIEMTWLEGTQRHMLARLPATVTPEELRALLGNRLAGLPRWWLVPADMALRRRLVLPAAAAERLRDVLAFELDRQTPFAAHEACFDARVLGVRDDGQLEVELAAVPTGAFTSGLARLGGLAQGMAGADVEDAEGGILGLNLLPEAARVVQQAPQRGLHLALAGVAQLIYMVWACRKAGVRLAVRGPRITPQVKRLGLLILPATFGAGIYQISQLVDTFFATSLPQGSLTLLKLADRLNQMPLGIFGIALGTAILLMLARHIQSDDRREAQRLQANAVEVGTLLTLPAAAALAICAPAFVTAFFVGGKMTPDKGAIMAHIVTALVCGLPAYVLVKVFQPAFFSREDTRTPVWIAAGALVINIGLNFLVVPRFGIVGLAAATATTATLNVLTLYTILQMRGWFHFTGKLGGRIGRQLIATAAMSAALWLLMPLMASRYGGNVFERVWSLGVLVASGLIVFFAVAWLVGALDKDLLAQLRRRRSKPQPAE